MYVLLACMYAYIAYGNKHVARHANKKEKIILLTAIYLTIQWHVSMLKTIYIIVYHMNGIPKNKNFSL